MKRSLHLALFSLLLLTFGSHSLKAQDVPKTVPNFIFFGTNGTPITKMQFSSTKPLVVMFFDPGCDHCQDQAKVIQSGEAALADVQFLFVSIAEPADIDGFAKTYFGASKLNTKFAHDKKFAFDGYFGYSEAPTIIVFDSKGNMVGRFTKEASVDDIAKIAK